MKTGLQIVPTSRGFETHYTGSHIGRDEPLAIHATLRDAIAHLATLLDYHTQQTESFVEE